MRKLLSIIVLGLLLSTNAYAEEYDLTCVDTGKFSEKPISFVFEERNKGLYIATVYSKKNNKIGGKSLTHHFKSKSVISWINIMTFTSGKTKIYKYELRTDKKLLKAYMAHLKDAELDEVKNFHKQKNDKLISDKDYFKFKEKLMYSYRDVMKKYMIKDCYGTIFERR